MFRPIAKLAVSLFGLFSIPEPQDLYSYPAADPASQSNCLSVNPWLPNIDLNPQPVIGILSQTMGFGGEKFSKYKSYIMAAYVRHVESSGARVIPILMSDDEETVLHKLSIVNGVLIPGGGGDYKRVGKFILDEAIKKNDRGEFFPVWGTCLGFEFLAYATAEREHVLDVYFAKKVGLPIEYKKDPKKTRMFCQMGKMAKELESGDYLINQHKYGVGPEVFEEDPKLKEFWDVTSVSRTPNGTVFTATIEAKNYPFMATMFHPEKISYTFNDHIGLNHSWRSIEINRYFADLFVKMARANNNTVGNFKQSQSLLIHNYDFYATTFYSGDIYVFE